MAISEFSLIDQYFKSRRLSRDDVDVGIGDDAAVTRIPPGMQLVSAMDTLVSGVHFPVNTPAHAIGHKSLAVNLSDIAAMGAEPAWATLALTLPEADESWVKHFCDGFFQLAESCNVELIGGDTTQGPMTVTVQVSGFVPEGKAILRSGAKVGDLIFISGTLGESALALNWLENNSREGIPLHISECIAKLDLPIPRLSLGKGLRDIATAAIDVSDGLVADLSHVLTASGVGAVLFQEKIPMSSIETDVDDPDSLQRALYGGDDYEICFTAAESDRGKIQKLSRQLNLSVTEIGVIEQQKNIRLSNKNVCIDLSPHGYEHFSKS